MVSEAHVASSTFSAQYGLAAGVVTYKMAGGTNTYHGDAFFINRNNFFDSVGFFNGPAWGGSNKAPDQSPDQLRLHLRRAGVDSPSV